MDDYQPCIVVQFGTHVSPSTVTWLKNRIKDKKSNGGCKLDVDEVENEGACMLYVHASKKRLEAGAEILGIKKKCSDGSMREFCASRHKHFDNYKDDCFFSESEIQHILKNELDSLRAINEISIPGHDDVKLYPGKSIFRRLQTSGLVTAYFPLHNQRHLDTLSVNWFRNLKIGDVLLNPPINDIQQYFGDSIGFYFAFFSFYTKSLIPFLSLTLLYWLLGGYEDAYHRVDVDWLMPTFYVLWAIFTMEFWRRKSAELSYQWGSYKSKQHEEPRNGFRGELGINEITEKPEPTYPSWKRLVRIYLVSWPIVGACTAVAVWLMFYYFSWELYLNNKYKNDSSWFGVMITNFPSIAYSIIVKVANDLFFSLAHALTSKENHRLESTFQNHFVAKLLVFFFIDNFLSLFYIAFIHDDMDMLRTTLRSLFIVNSFMSQVVSTLIPYLQQYVIPSIWNKHKTDKKTTKKEMSREQQTQSDLLKDDFAGTFDDYFELWIQFGYVTMFCCVYPPGVLFALVSNLIELRSDAFKVSYICRRPFVYQESSIGIWEFAFRALTYLSIVSNLALVVHSPRFVDWFQSIFADATMITIVVSFFFLEHILLVMRWIISIGFPSEPHYVKVQHNKLQYQAMQALKKSRIEFL